MYIRRLIEEYFASSSAALHARDGAAIPREIIRREYRAIKGFLLEAGTSRGAVAICLEHDYRYVLCILACMETGTPYIPLNPRWPRSRVDQIRELTAFSCVISSANIDEVLAHGAAAAAPPAAPDPEGPLYIMCTSGTTGKPKAVVIPRRAYESQLLWLKDLFPRLDQDSRILLIADFTFDMSLGDLALALLKRCSLYCSQSEGNPFRLAHEIGLHRINSVFAVPGSVSLLMRDAVSRRTDYSALRYLQIGGADFPPALYRSVFERISAETVVYNAYGATETTICTHMKRLSGPPAAEIRDFRVCIGKPSPAVSCRLVDPAGAEVSAPGEVGELLMGGAQLMTEYMADPDKTRECLVDIGGVRYFRTGDLAVVDENQEYYIVGRKDDTIKRRGYRINLSDIDAYIRTIAGVRDCATIALRVPEAEHLVVACLAVERPASENELRLMMAKVLVDHQMPDRIEIFDELPRSDSGKVSRSALAKNFNARSEREG